MPAQAATVHIRLVSLKWTVSGVLFGVIKWQLAPYNNDSLLLGGRQTFCGLMPELFGGRPALQIPIFRPPAENSQASQGRKLFFQGARLSDRYKGFRPPIVTLLFN